MRCLGFFWEAEDGIRDAQESRGKQKTAYEMLRSLVGSEMCIRDSHSVVADRLHGTAVLRGDQVRHMGVLGYVARASGVPIDARADHPFVDLGPSFHVVTQPDGDVWARF